MKASKKELVIFLTSILLITGCLDNEHKSKKIKDMKSDTASRNKASVHSFFRALESGNADQVASLFTQNAKHINPYASGLFPEGANGREGIRAYWKPVFPNFGQMKFSIEEIYAMEDPNIVYTKYLGVIQLKDGAGIYQNDYYSTFTFDEDGLIAEYVEIFNPILAARAFGLIDQIK